MLELLCRICDEDVAEGFGLVRVLPLLNGANIYALLVSQETQAAGLQYTIRLRVSLLRLSLESIFEMITPDLGIAVELDRHWGIFTLEHPSGRLLSEELSMSAILGNDAKSCDYLLYRT